MRRAWPVLRVLGAVASIAIVAVVAVAAVRNLHGQRLAWGWLAPACAAALVWWLALARAWSLLAAGVSRGSDMRVWLRTQALRYLPGGIWAPVSRVAVVSGSAAERVSTVTAENVISLAAALGIGGLALAVSRSPGWVALLLVPAIPVAIASATHRLPRLSRERVLAVTATNLGAFVAYAVAAVFAQAAVSGLHLSVAAIAGAAAVAWAAGLVVVFSPSGIGVREVTYLALATGVVPRSEAVTASVALRAVTVVVELVVLACVSVRMGRLRSKRRREG